jgi:hypothetical protein
MPRVEVRNLSKSFEPGKPVLSDISLSVEEGEFVSLLPALPVVVRHGLGAAPVRAGGLALHDFQFSWEILGPRGAFRARVELRSRW